jgi:hypothetical protein
LARRPARRDAHRDAPSADGYITLMRAERNEVVNAEPFQAIALAVGTLFGDDRLSTTAWNSVPGCRTSRRIEY